MGIPVMVPSINGTNYSNIHGVVSSSGPAFKNSPLNGTLSTIRNYNQDQNFDIRLPDKPADDKPTATEQKNSEAPNSDLYQKYVLGQGARTALEELYLSDSDDEVESTRVKEKKDLDKKFESSSIAVKRKYDEIGKSQNEKKAKVYIKNLLNSKKSRERA